MTALEAALMPLIRQAVRDELRATGALGSADTYDSRHLPPDLRSVDRFHRLARHVPGARKVGRIWTVSRDAWHVYRAKTPASAGRDVSEVVSRMAAKYRTA